MKPMHDLRGICSLDDKTGMVRKMVKAEVEIDISMDDVIHYIREGGTLDVIMIFVALSKAITDESLSKLRDFLGAEEFQELVDITRNLAGQVYFAQQLSKSIERR